MSQEREVKFYITDLRKAQIHLLAAGAEIIKPRVFERNLRFDDAAGSLTEAGRLLRLRDDGLTRLTYKDRANVDDVISEREELEVHVSDFDTAFALLTALGYGVSVQYEKYRTTYLLRDVEVDMDEMPYGYFLEIEGPDAQAIQEAASLLKLNWDTRSTQSYITLFERLRAGGLDARHLTFDQLRNQTFTAADFGLEPADR